MNQVVIKYKDGSQKSLKTKLTDTDKIIKFLKLVGEWNDEVISLELLEDVVSVSCSYQNMEEN